MKKFKYTIASFTFLITALVCMSFTSPPVDNGNGNVVTIDNPNDWYWIADNCITAPVHIDNIRVQYATNGHVNVTGSLQLPDGHCDIPAKGATTIRYNDGVSRAVINSKGKVNFKINISPN